MLLPFPPSRIPRRTYFNASLRVRRKVQIARTASSVTFLLVFVRHFWPFSRLRQSPNVQSDSVYRVSKRIHEPSQWHQDSLVGIWVPTKQKKSCTACFFVFFYWRQVLQAPVSIYHSATVGLIRFARKELRTSIWRQSRSFYSIAGISLGSGDN